MDTRRPASTEFFRFNCQATVLLEEIRERTCIYRPTGALRDYVEALWTRTTCGLREKLNARWDLPHAGCDLVFRFGDVRNHDARHFFIGACTIPRLIPFEGAQNTIGVRFTATGAQALFGCPQYALTNRWGPPEAIFASRSDNPVDRLAESRSEQDRLDILQGFLLRVFAKTPELDTRMQAVVRMIARDRGAVAVGRLPKKTGYSRRHLNRMFRRFLGMSPKLFCRIVRFRNTVELMGARTVLDSVDVATELGYADQAHFIHEVKVFSTETPLQLMASIDRAGGIAPGVLIPASNQWIERVGREKLETLSPAVTDVRSALS